MEATCQRKPICFNVAELYFVFVCLFLLDGDTAHAKQRHTTKLRGVQCEDQQLLIEVGVGSRHSLGTVCLPTFGSSCIKKVLDKVLNGSL